MADVAGPVESVTSSPPQTPLDRIVALCSGIMRTWTFPLIFISLWGYAVYKYGLFLGIGLGWFPAFVIALLFAKPLHWVVSIGLVVVAFWWTTSEINRIVRSIEHPWTLAMFLGLGALAVAAIWSDREKLRLHFAQLPPGQFTRSIIAVSVPVVLIGLAFDPYLTGVIVALIGAGLLSAKWRKRQSGETAVDERHSGAPVTMRPAGTCPRCGKFAMVHAPEDSILCRRCRHSIPTADLIVGSTTGHIYHRPTCRQTISITTRDALLFGSSWEAVLHDYQACEMCDPPPVYRHFESAAASAR
jgi:hypothetical protein